LYHEAFGDSEGFRNFFFDRKYASANVVFQREGSQIVSALHFVSKTLSVRGKKLAVPYVVAAATRKDHRGKGLMRAVLDNAFQELQHRNLPLCALSPFSEAYYRQSGFVTIHRYGPTDQPHPATDPFTYEPVAESGMNEVIALYERKTAGADVFVFRNPQEWDLFFHEIQADEGRIVLVRENGFPVGYFTLFGEEVEEVCFPDPAKQGGSSWLARLHAPVFGPNEPESHTMVRIVDVRKWLTEYPYDPSWSGTRRLRITDASFPSGTMTLELTVRNGKAAVREIEAFDEEITIEGLTEEMFLTGSPWFPKPNLVLFDKY
jgi:predicted acetyltransferase